LLFALLFTDFLATLASFFFGAAGAAGFAAGAA